MDYQTFADTYFGGNASAIARQFGVVPSTVANWKKVGVIPELRAAQIELWILKNPNAPTNDSPPSPSERVEASSPS